MSRTQDREVYAEEGRVVVGQLARRTRDAGGELRQLQAAAASLRPSIRRGSNGQWFAVLVGPTGAPVATSDSLPSENLAWEAARHALAVLLASVASPTG